MVVRTRVNLYSDVISLIVLTEADTVYLFFAFDYSQAFGELLKSLEVTLNNLQ